MAVPATPHRSTCGRYWRDIDDANCPDRDGWLYVLASRPYIPDYDARPQQTEDGGNAASHRHDLTIKPWMPQVNATVLVLYLPVEGGDGFILGEIGALGQIKQ